ncbi:hypothetical protein [Pseudogemmobacter humi]|uniref:Uncharacterized protein n=1 Tax=Pseudogemmobacter humi TaxID=2483812 RepID=A0A3P5XRU2_9RHOB|nr:hypothetical protein [Pseudogemmobacter humi]VDC33085.1 hypothetical protein XINFAN_03630 [Pseudogemmobacter humi]
MSAVTIRQMADRVEGLLSERLGARGRDFEAKLRHSGRKLPRRVRAAAKSLARAAEMARNPKLQAQLDEGDVARDYDICLRHFSAGGSGAWFRGVVGRVAASVGFSLLVVGLGFAGWLLWRGYI